MNTDKKHNGWTNYETWAVALWMDNEESSQTYWNETARELYENAEDSAHCNKYDSARFDLADRIKEQHEEAQPEVTGVFADLLNAAMSEVNWQEIATHYIDEVVEAEKSEST